MGKKICKIFKSREFNAYITLRCTFFQVIFVTVIALFKTTFIGVFLSSQPNISEQTSDNRKLIVEESFSQITSSFYHVLHQLDFQMAIYSRNIGFELSQYKQNEEGDVACLGPVGDNGGDECLVDSFDKAYFSKLIGENQDESLYKHRYIIGFDVIMQQEMNETNEFFQKFYFDTFPGIEQIISFTAFVHSIDDGMIDEFNIVRRNEEFIGLFNYPHFKGHSMTTEIKQEVMSICYSEYGDGGSFLRRYNDDLIYGLLLNSEDCVYFRLNQQHLRSILSDASNSFSVLDLNNPNSPAMLLQPSSNDLQGEINKLIEGSKFDDFSKNQTSEVLSHSDESLTTFTTITNISTDILKGGRIYLGATKVIQNEVDGLRILNFVSLSDLFIVLPIFAFISFQLILMFREIYYILFSQMNLFTYKLKRFNQNMLKEQTNNKFRSFNIEELIFTEDNEIKLFFKKFFNKFNENKKDNFFDVKNKLINDNTDGIFGNKEYKLRFNENVISPIEKSLMVRGRARSKSIINF